MQYSLTRFPAIATTTAQSRMSTNPMPTIPQRANLRKREAYSSFPSIRWTDFAPMIPLVTVC